MRSFILVTLMLLLPSVALAQSERQQRLHKKVAGMCRSDICQVSVSIVHLPSGEQVEVEAQQPWPLASVFKVPVMIELARQMQAQKGSLQLNTQLAIAGPDRCIGSGPLQHQPVGSKVSVQRLVELMETRSDNTATDMLFRRIGLTSVDTWMHSLGCISSQIYLTNRAAWLISLGRSSDFKGLEPRQIAQKWQKMKPEARLEAALKAEQENLKTSLSQFQAWEDQSAKDNTHEENVVVATTVDNLASAHDLAVVLGKLYQGELLDKKWSDYCLGVLGRQSFNTRIPRNLPKGTRVYHKTGTIAGVVNDIGIIELQPGQGLVVVVLCKNVAEGCDAQAEQIIARISRAAYDAYKP